MENAAVIYPAELVYSAEIDCALQLECRMASFYIHINLSLVKQIFLQEERKKDFSNYFLTKRRAAAEFHQRV